MELLSILIGGALALCLGASSVLATAATRRVGAPLTTLIIQAIEVLVLVSCLGAASGPLGLSPAALRQSFLPGLLLGLATTTIGKLTLYRSLKLGPIALVTPIISAEGIVALLLAVLFLHEPLSASAGLVALTTSLGVLLITTPRAALPRMSLQPQTSLATSGTFWAVITLLAFGSELFGIGVLARQFGWFLPIFWSRCIALPALGLVIGGTSIYNAKQHPPEDQRSDTSRMISWSGWLLAGAAGMLDIVGLLGYSLETRLLLTSLAAILVSCNVLIPFGVGLFRFQERPALHQLAGVGLVVTGLVILAIH